MLDHVTIGVTDLRRARAFYDRALHPLGVTFLYGDEDDFAGYGRRPRAFFWIGLREGSQTSAHVAFAADSRSTVDRFHREAMAAGGRDNGAPGLRVRYGPGYYAAFVLDPDGHNVEAVCRRARPLPPSS